MDELDTAIYRKLIIEGEYADIKGPPGRRFLIIDSHYELTPEQEARILELWDSEAGEDEP